MTRIYNSSICLLVRSNHDQSINKPKFHQQINLISVYRLSSKDSIWYQLRKVPRFYIFPISLRWLVNYKTFKTSLRKIAFKLTKELLAENYIFYHLLKCNISEGLLSIHFISCTSTDTVDTTNQIFSDQLSSSLSGFHLIFTIKYFKFIYSILVRLKMGTYIKYQDFRSFCTIFSLRDQYWQQYNWPQSHILAADWQIDVHNVTDVDEEGDELGDCFLSLNLILKIDDHEQGRHSER